VLEASTKMLAERAKNPLPDGVLLKTGGGVVGHGGPASDPAGGATGAGTLAATLRVSEAVMAQLSSAGYDSAIAIAAASLGDLKKTTGLPLGDVKQLSKAAKEEAQKQVLAALDAPLLALLEANALTEEVGTLLAKEKLTSFGDLDDTSIEDLVEMVGMSKDAAQKLLGAKREAEKAAEEAAAAVAALGKNLSAAEKEGDIAALVAYLRVAVATKRRKLPLH
jgi:hypothetical protein